MNLLSHRVLPRAVAAFSVLVACATFRGQEPVARAAVSTPYVSAGRVPIGPGVFHDHGTIETTTAGRQAVHIVEVDAGQPLISFEASLSNDRTAGLETTSSQANRKNREGHRAVAAVN